MRLYSLTGATALTDPEFGSFDAGPDGSFDLPEEFAERLHAFHFGGRPAWETDIERQARLMNEELERRKDPATLLSAVEQLVKAAAQVSTQDPDEAPPASTRAKKSAASKSARQG